MPSDFTPISRDVRHTRLLLNSLGLPFEIILPILDYAGYWTSRTTSRFRPLKLRNRKYTPSNSSAVAYLATRVSLRSTSEGELPEVRGVNFSILSHAQNGTSEPTRGMYDTSSWFEVSVVRGDLPQWPPVFADVEAARTHCKDVTFIPRGGEDCEENRGHCDEREKVMRAGEGKEERPDEGTYAWYLQGNPVVSGSHNVNELDMEHRVRWEGAHSEGNEGAGKGEGFVDCLRDGDWIVLWARVKRQGWENHVYSANISVRYTIGDE
ncbi:hypothetical protein BU23DRAFT_598226 [Bimuria novae-zelandiae CBS 107.79]|uniref:Uncharacterized protein n=1 Tax=Bimuria novae-zelandiae CBS 107.79 TaxID=1447943 RepID=A0A6A5VBI6_9PLEO|nr:hypothetical protein BU23DRAFT_598226 [Bimuria novae-zelandiae CBS 107.79]